MPHMSIELHHSDLMLADVSNSSVVIVYLFREGCIVTQEKLELELPPDAVVLSVGFALRGWEASWVLRPTGCVPLYFYSQVGFHNKQSLKQRSSYTSFL